MHPRFSSLSIRCFFLFCITCKRNLLKFRTKFCCRREAAPLLHLVSKPIRNLDSQILVVLIINTGVKRRIRQDRSLSPYFWSNIVLAITHLTVSKEQVQSSHFMRCCQTNTKTFHSIYSHLIFLTAPFFNN